MCYNSGGEVGGGCSWSSLDEGGVLVLAGRSGAEGQRNCACRVLVLNGGLQR